MELRAVNNFTENDLASYLEVARPQLQILILRLDLLGPTSLSILFTKCTNLKELTVRTLLRGPIIELHNQFERWELGQKKRFRKLGIVFRGRPNQYPNRIVDNLLNGMNEHAVEWHFEACCPAAKKKPYAIHDNFFRHQKFTDADYRRHNSRNH